MRLLVRVLACALVCLAAARAAEAQTYLWFEPQLAIDRLKPVTLTSESWATDMEGREVNHQTYTEELGRIGNSYATLTFGHLWKPHLGIMMQTAHGTDWGETVIGPAFSPAKGLVISPAVGIEHLEPNLLRFRLHVDYDHEGSGSFLYSIFDTDRESRWIQIDAAYMFNSRVGLGTYIEMPGIGAGPKLELRLGNHVGFWAAPVYEWREKKARFAMGGRLMWDR